MNTRKLAFVLIFSIFLGSTLTAQAASPAEKRYFIGSQSNFWKNSFGIRHAFHDGFTADLTDWELKLAKIFNLQVYPVKKFSILPDPTATPVQLPALTDSVPWGVETVYNDPLLAHSSGGEGVLVAVLDTGVDTKHPDLARRIAGCRDFSDSKHSLVEDSCIDENGHGTHVAGIIAADGGPDGTGIWGVAPESQILAYKVCQSDGSCWSDDVAGAIRGAVEAGAHVINLSIGGDSQSSLMDEAMDFALEKNILIVAAAGNDGPYPGSIDFPAAQTKTVSVAAIDVSFVTPEWSSHGQNTDTEPGIFQDGDLYFVAPGVNIQSTWLEGDYALLSGTSMAAPHVAGLAAKLWQLDSENPSANVLSVLEKLSTDVDPVGEDNASGLGFPHL